MSSLQQVTVLVASLYTQERYFKSFEAECWNQTRTSLVAGPLLAAGVHVSASGGYVQKDPLYFRGLTRGTVYSFRSRVHLVDGGEPSTWSPWADETAGDTIAPSVYFSPSSVQTAGGVLILATPSGGTIPTDIDHYEFYWNLTGVVPSSNTPPNAPLSVDGRLHLVIRSEDAASVWVRGVDTSGNRQSWFSLGVVRQLGVIDLAGLYVAQQYHNSAIREPSSVSRNGQTASTSWVTLSQFDIESGKPVTYQGALRCTKITSPTASYGPKAPGTSSGWVNSNNVFVEDAVNATTLVLASSIGATLNVTNFGFSIPTTEVLQSISFRVKRMRSNPDPAAFIKDNLVKLIVGGAESGNNVGDVANWPTALTNKTYNSGWGTLPTATQVNQTDFGIRIIPEETGGFNTSAQIDYIECTIVTDGGSYTMKARLKIGASLSSEVVLNSPATTLTQTKSISGVGPGTITVEVQAQVTTLTGGSVEVDFTQKRYTDQHKDNVQIQ